MIHHYRHTLTFYLLSAAMPWSLWLMAAALSHRPDAAQYGLLISALGLAGLCAPLLTALALAARDRAVLRDMAQRLTRIAPGSGVYVGLALVLMPASILAAMALSLLLGYDADQFVISGQTSFSSTVFPVWFILLSAPIIEELAWHSYGVDCLRRRFSLLTSSLLFALYWGLWHLPLALIDGYYHSNLAAQSVIHSFNFLVSLFPFVLLMNWLYYKTGRNILITVALHMSANVFNEIFATHPDSKMIQTLLLLGLCAYLLWTERALFLNRDLDGEISPPPESSAPLPHPTP
ncbi:CPBP family intramembrane glutamic endopeptidase [Magnetofaba australis]|uniref:Putative CAAX amino terminal protease family protein n=1 Tax=Magnetofaba australis IT-1 TaxID=1434232 RepID=A0A1Y2K2F1_9PROT|nr:CPBP family intramembrane glutamic endopeptidase [Magnetofaba australis]OSM01364.1 putative CAAX amino terminal protease family protein [Magnetofaba australis IT-1]